MNQKLPTTEDELRNFLAPAHGAGLSDAERLVMKSELMAYAQFHENKTAHTAKAIATLRVWWGAAMAAFVLVTSVTAGYASTYSVPGDSLYAVKVDMVEPLIGLSHTNDIAQLQYQVTLMERRLNEVHALSDDAALTPEGVAIVEAELTDRVASFETILESDSDASIPSTVVLDAASRVHALAEAHVELSAPVTDTDNQEGVSFQDVVDDAADRYTVEVEEFVATASPEVVSEYISDVLADIEASLTTETDLASTSVSELRDNIEQAAEALGRHEFDEALLNANAAQHVLEVEGYTDIEAASDPQDSSADVREEGVGDIDTE